MSFRSADETVKNWRWWVALPYVLLCFVCIALPGIAIGIIGRLLKSTGNAIIEFETFYDNVAGEFTMSKQVVKWIFDKRGEGE